MKKKLLFSLAMASESGSQKSTSPSFTERSRVVRLLLVRIPPVAVSTRVRGFMETSEAFLPPYPVVCSLIGLPEPGCNKASLACSFSLDSANWKQSQAKRGSPRNRILEGSILKKALKEKIWIHRERTQL
jgi:hypothetical protein